MSWLKQLLLNGLYKKTIKSNALSKKRSDLKVLRTVSIILDHRMSVEISHFNKMGKALNIPKSNIRVLTYCQSDSMLETTNTALKYTGKDITKWGVMNDFLNEFCTRKTDVLINYFDKNDINLNYVSAKTDHQISVGLKTVDHTLNDLIIDVDPKEIDVFISECLKYLKIFFNVKK
ncbi:MAG: DUF6913 domain-containing protein [Flavobacteriaceae bacterium]|tara:strand:- start:454 stop:981 length:528 start_codon:yes stop_codon:yes gene_type:complete